MDESEQSKPEQQKPEMRVPTHGHGKLLAHLPPHEPFKRDPWGRYLSPKLENTQITKDRIALTRAAQRKRMVPKVLEELFRIVMTSPGFLNRIEAAKVLLDRLEGKPVQMIVPGSEQGGKAMSWEDLLKQVKAAGPPGNGKTRQ